MIRSLLYVPANQPRFVEKAHLRGADAIILDLEDAVVPAEKTNAREALQAAVPQAGQGGATVYVRVNSEPDLIVADAQAACRAGAHGLLVPKAQGAGHLGWLAEQLAGLETGRQPLDFILLLEDPGALLDARAIAKVPRVAALCLGSEDFATAMGAVPSPEVLRVPKLLVHYAAKAEGKRSYGLLRSSVDYRDTEAYAAAATEARAFGFDGATCIHPGCIDILNRAFAPSAEELEWSRRVVEAYREAEREGRGAFLLDGRFVDLPVVTRALAVLRAGGL